MNYFTRGLSIRFSIKPNNTNNRIIKGEIIIRHCERQNIHKYRGPGYLGKENGQLCEHPKGSKKFYKWNAFLCRWEDVYKNIPRTSQEPDWYDKLTNNAAFEAWWGNNTSGGNYLRSDRKRNGADNLWGDPGVGSRMGTFKQISGNVMQSIYRFTLNLKSAIGHYEKLSNAFGFENEIEEDSIISDTNDVYVEEEPKVIISIERLYSWSVWRAYGRIQQSGMSVKKDTAVYVTDSLRVQENIKRKNEELRQKRRDEFNNKQ